MSKSAYGDVAMGKGWVGDGGVFAGMDTRWLGRRAWL